MTMRPLQIALALLRASLMTAMQYRSDFLLDAFTGVLRTASSVAPILLVYAHRPTIAGWTEAEALLVLGLFFLMHALVSGLVEPNLGEVVEAIRSGALDLVLLKPADSQLLVSLRRVAPASIWDFLASLVVISLALTRLPAPGIADVAIAAYLLVCGLAAMYGLWLLAICASFWFVRVDNLRYLLWSTSDAGRLPLSVFGGALRWALTIVVPVGVITTFPVMALRGDWSAGLIAGTTAIALAFVGGSRWAWMRSLAAYTSASS